MKRCNEIYALLAVLVSQAAFSATDKASVQSSGNLIQVKAGSTRVMLFAPPDFQSLESYRFDIPYGPEKEAKKPVDLDALAKNAQRAYEKGHFDNAMIYVDEMIEEKPDLAKAWVMKGSLEFALGHKDDAKKAWEKSLELDPNNEHVKKSLTELK